MLFAEFSFKELTSWNEKSMLCTLTIKMQKVTFQKIPCDKSKHNSLLVQVKNYIISVRFLFCSTSLACMLLFLSNTQASNFVVVRKKFWWIIMFCLPVN